MELTLGSIVRNLRIERGMSGAVLADKCGLDRSAIFKIENGDRYPQPKTIAVLANVLGVRVSDLTSPTACPLCGHGSKSS